MEKAVEYINIKFQDITQNVAKRDEKYKRGLHRHG